MLWKVKDRVIDLAARGKIMGILNVTPDSFSDGGKYTDLAAARQRAHAILAEGAEILDIGGESTRPGAEPVPEAEEIRRVVPLISALRPETDALISIDTLKPAVARAALAAGADIINDVSGFRHPDMISLAAESGAGCVVMHMQGEPRTMQHNPTYEDVVGEIRDFFTASLRSLTSAGIGEERIVFDPGIGFGKTISHNLALLRNLSFLSAAGRPLLLGVSRKSFIGAVLGTNSLSDRHWPTVALTSFAREAGVRLLRVHDVLPNVHALRMTEAILNCAQR